MTQKAWRDIEEMFYPLSSSFVQFHTDQNIVNLASMFSIWVYKASRHYQILRFALMIQGFIWQWFGTELTIKPLTKYIMV